MIDRNEAILAMINVAKGTASPSERDLFDSLDDRTFSDLYNELESKLTDSSYSIEDYYEIPEEKDECFEDGAYLTEEEEELEDQQLLGESEKEDRDETIRAEFRDFFREFGEDYESEDEAYKDFIENYCSCTTDKTYSDLDNLDYEVESLVIEEFSEFLVSQGREYSNLDEAYEDYCRNFCSYL